jgi:hypothetical protein
MTTNNEAIAKINFYSQLFVDMVSKGVKDNTISGLEAGRIALKLVGCPDNVAKAIEDSMFNHLNK